MDLRVENLPASPGLLSVAAQTGDHASAEEEARHNIPVVEYNALGIFILLQQLRMLFSTVKGHSVREDLPQLGSDTL